MLVAKPVIANQFWILKEDDRKVGNIEATGDGYQVKIDNQVSTFKTIKLISQRTDIEFEAAIAATKAPVPTNVEGYPASGKVYNPIWDVKHKLPLYTKTKKSKSWFAAGWYLVKQRRTWETVQSPKLITLLRYPYHGPFLRKSDANDKSVS